MLRAASAHSGPSKANDEPDEKGGFLPVGFRARAHTEVRHSLDGRLGGQTRTFGGLDDIFQLERARRLRGRRSACSHDRKIIGLENPGSVCHGETEIIGGVAMSPLDVADNKAATDTKTASPAYVPPLQRTEGQPPPIAAHGGLSYMSFDREGDAGTAAALQDALAEIAEGEGQRVTDMIAKAPPGPIKTKWGLGFRDYDECLKYIRQSNTIKAPEGGLALPLPYTVYERPTYSVVPSNALWRDPARADIAEILRKNEKGNRRRDLYFPQVMRDARRIGEYYPGLSPGSR